jgi:hypothetical protein
MWDPIPGGVTWKSPSLLTFRTGRAFLTSSLGEPHAVNLDSNGLGLFDVWALRFPCGLEATVSIFHLHPNGSGAAITNPNEPANIEIHANERDLAHILFHLPMASSGSHTWKSSACVEGPRNWVVAREDDHGNRYDVARFTSECEAAAAARTFEGRGHKQIYWVEQR